MSETTILNRYLRRRMTEVPLAWRNLTADRKRLVRSAAGIGFAVLLMFMQLGFRNAFIDSSLELLRQLDGDVFLVNATKYRVGWIDPFPRTRIAQALAVPGVTSARPLYIEQNRSIWKNLEDQSLNAIQVIGFDPDRPVFVAPEINAKREQLKQPDTVLMDSRARRFLGPRREGIRTELARRDIRVIGTFPLGPDFITDGTLVMSDRNFLKFFPATGQSPPHLTRVEIGVIKTAATVDVERVQTALRQRLPGDVLVLTKPELLNLQESFHSKVSSVGPIFALGAGIGFVVGMLIAYQIMNTELSDQLPQYATLKAIGYGNRYLMQVVLEQAIFFAVIGFLPALAISWLLYGVVGEIALLPMRMSVFLISSNFALTVGMCITSGAIAVRRVLAADPAEVF